ncbi:hypothetical protein CH276_14060 [Rhodococcus sp. 06-470-2]|uniref:hypothetical protein n=1 Tax=unclassified Rhodococcus (in: high G+C Gram-positive bacteria) TaxID=192944 RepID=UPI000B9B530F|nr:MULTISPECIES: hypothetical protein [unclassified Rhodococcus (in: high G+C Gram-positive bacteria)]OZC62741.1 hypothetical protein CH276_14060 [Rhodococcus sp. 06-470-2]OZE71718.1 hypothetical protein CH265_01540 [Rhodococcus sp. 05-2221-1B]
MSEYIQVDHGRIVVDDVLEKPKRHLTLVASDNWPTEADTDPYEHQSNPVTVALWCALMSIAIGFVTWAAW